MKALTICILVTIKLIVPVHLQDVEPRRYRPVSSKCDRYGRCPAKEGYIEDTPHDDDYKSEKERPAIATRDDWPVRPISGDTYENKRDGRPAGGGGHKPTADKDDTGGRPGSGGYGGGGYGGGHNTKPTVDKDDDKVSAGRPGSGYGGGYNPKPSTDRDDDVKSGRPGGGGGRGGYGGGGYKPKPVVDRDDDDIISGGRPGGAGGGYGGGYNPKPVVDRDEYNPKPGGNRGGGYNPKPGDDDYDIKPIRGGGGGGYYPNDDDDDDDDRKTDKDDLGGYNNPKDDDYNDYETKGIGKDDDYDIKPIPVVDGNCICVPYYQCTDGHIVTDGAGIIDARKKPDPEEELPLDGKFKPPSCGPYHVCCNTPETSTVKPYEHRCGVRNPSGINSRVLSPSNKGEADFGEWPWQAAVLKSEGKVNIFQCGGVLIDKYHVLTVAHCVGM